MTNTEAAALVAILHGAYPGTYFDGAVAEVFTNSLLVANYDIAHTATMHWVNSMDRFPTIRELNGEMTRMRNRENENRELARPENKTADKPQACEAFSRGYIRARTEAGEAMETIQPKLERLLRQWGLIPTSEPGLRERTGSGRKPTVPSRHQPGYLRSSTGTPVDQPAFDGSTIAEPW